MSHTTPDEIAVAPELRQCECSCSHNEWQHRNGDCWDHDIGPVMEQEAYADAYHRQEEEDYCRQMEEEYRASLAEEKRHGGRR